ncbi:hypothetical protein APP_11800 [Aeribacillus pallidus]|nr:hypothetical protein APP_11800 [Aeribacillus pallidus]
MKEILDGFYKCDDCKKLSYMFNKLQFNTNASKSKCTKGNKNTQLKLSWTAKL